jgi:hypothetical protein
MQVLWVFKRRTLPRLSAPNFSSDLRTRALFPCLNLFGESLEFGQIGSAEPLELDNERRPGERILTPLVFIGLRVRDDPAHMYADGDGPKLLVASVFSFAHTSAFSLAPPSLSDHVGPVVDLLVVDRLALVGVVASGVWFDHGSAGGAAVIAHACPAGIPTRIVV